MSAPPICWSRTAPTWCWPRRSVCGRSASARCAWRCTKVWRDWWPSRCGRWPSSRWQSHPRFKYFGEAGEEPYQSFLGVPLIDRGVLQGVLVVQTIEARTFSGGRDSDAGGGGGAGGAGGQRSAHARSLHRAGAGAAVVAGAQSVVELGPRLDQPVPRSGSGALAGAESQSDFAAGRDSAGEAGAARGRTGAARPHQLRVPPPAGIPAGGPHLGRDACGRSAAAAGGVLLGGVRTARIAADLLRRPGRAGRRPHQERVRSGHSAGRRSDCSTARAISASGWIGNGWQQEEYLQTDVNQLPMEPAIGKNGEPVTVQIETRGGIDSRQRSGA